MLNSHFDKTAVVERLAAVSGTNKQSYQAHIAALACHVQPLDGELSGDIEGGFGKNFLMFSGAADIIEGDRVTINSLKYRVVSTEQFSFNNKIHRETVIRIFKS